MRNFVLITTLCITHFCSGQIHETFTFNHMKEFIEEKTLYLFDIDNTIYHPTQHLGSDQWFYWKMEDYLKQNCSADEAVEKALYDWIAIQHITDVVPVEEGIDIFVKQMQQDSHVIMGLTTRDMSLNLKTIEQLNRIGVDLSVTAPLEEEVHFMNGKGVLYKKGILFTSGTHKGKALLAFLDKIEFSPKRIVFINDKASHLNEVAVSVEEKGIEFIGLRYGASDERVRQFDENIARLQFEHFGKIISDEEAQSLINSSKG